MDLDLDLDLEMDLTIDRDFDLLLEFELGDLDLINLGLEGDLVFDFPEFDLDLVGDLEFAVDLGLDFEDDLELFDFDLEGDLDIGFPEFDLPLSRELDLDLFLEASAFALLEVLLLFCSFDFEEDLDFGFFDSPEFDLDLVGDLEFGVDLGLFFEDDLELFDFDLEGDLDLGFPEFDLDLSGELDLDLLLEDSSLASLEIFLLFCSFSFSWASLSSCIFSSHFLVLISSCFFKVL